MLSRSRLTKLPCQRINSMHHLLGMSLFLLLLIVFVTVYSGNTKESWANYSIDSEDTSGYSMAMPINVPSIIEARAPTEETPTVTQAPAIDIDDPFVVPVTTREPSTLPPGMSMQTPVPVFKNPPTLPPGMSMQTRVPVYNNPPTFPIYTTSNTPRERTTTRAPNMTTQAVQSTMTGMPTMMPTATPQEPAIDDLATFPPTTPEPSFDGGSRMSTESPFSMTGAPFDQTEPLLPGIRKMTTSTQPPTRMPTGMPSTTIGTPIRMTTSTQPPTRMTSTTTNAPIRRTTSTTQAPTRMPTGMPSTTIGMPIRMTTSTQPPTRMPTAMPSTTIGMPIRMTTSTQPPTRMPSTTTNAPIQMTTSTTQPPTRRPSTTIGVPIKMTTSTTQPPTRMPTRMPSTTTNAPIRMTTSKTQPPTRMPTRMPSTTTNAPIRMTTSTTQPPTRRPSTTIGVPIKMTTSTQPPTRMPTRMPSTTTGVPSKMTTSTQPTRMPTQAVRARQ